MSLFGILILIFAVLYVPNIFGFKFLPGARAKMRVALGLSFVFVGVLHFAATQTFALIVPPFLPYKTEIVLLSGVFEIFGGIALMLPRLQRLAAICLILLLIAVFPANIYMALYNVKVGGYMDLPVYQWVRLPFQFLLIWLVWWSTLSEPRAVATGFSSNGAAKGNEK